MKSNIHRKINIFLNSFEVTSHDFPEHYLKPLSNVDGYSLRVGDYRALIKLKKEEEEIFVGTLGHRRNIYDREL